MCERGQLVLDVVAKIIKLLPIDTYCHCTFFIVLEYCFTLLSFIANGKSTSQNKIVRARFCFFTQHFSCQMEDAKLLLCCGYHVEKTLNVNLYYNYYYSVLGLYTLCYIVVSYLEASALLASLPLRKKPWKMDSLVIRAGALHYLRFMS